MSETTTSQAPAQDTDGENTDQAQAAGAAPAQEGDQTDWKAMARKWETQAKANKAAAAELTALKEASKTQAEKQADQLAALKAQNAALEASIRVRDVAATHGVPAKFLQGIPEDEVEDAAKELAKLIAKPAADVSRRGGPVVPGEGTGKTKTIGTTGEKFAAFLEDKLK